MRLILIFSILFLNFYLVAQNKQMSLEDAVWGRYSYLNPKSQSFSWKNNFVFSTVKNDTLWLENAESGERMFFADTREIATICGESVRYFPSYLWTENENLMVSFARTFFLIDSKKKTLISKIQLPENAENAEYSEKGEFVAFTVDDNLFVAFPNKETVQITRDGGNGIVYGKSVHRNEFGITKGIFNSPNGNFIAFYRKDETMVKDYPLVDFMARQAEHRPEKYPMAGMESHQVKLGIYNIKSGKTIFLNTGEPLDKFLTNVAWSPDEKSIYIAELNRKQNHMQLNAFDVSKGEKEKTLFEEKSETYVEPEYPILFSKTNKKEFYYLSRKDGWYHFYKYDVNGQLLRQITSGKWEITRVLGFDKNENYVFVESTKKSVLENHIYRVDLQSGEMIQLTNPEGVHNGELSSGGSFIIDSRSATDNPGATDLLNSEGKMLKNLYQKENTLSAYVLGENRLVEILSGDGETPLTGRLILPVNFDETKKYPVIVYVYGGPHSQLVNKSWQNGARWWQYYMASQGFISFTMDNRGTSHRGRDFETAIHRKLGILETEDQMKGVEYLKSLPFVDAERIGVHGWSYGGFMTLNLMLRHPETFKAGVAGGPVVDWSMYEIMYGERYMDMPQENSEGYRESNMLNFVPKLKGKLMLIHGVQDNTVVMQHSMKFLRECVIQGKQVDFFAYPTHPHNVRGKDRIHLMEKVSNYFFDYL